MDELLEVRESIAHFEALPKKITINEDRIQKLGG